MPTGILINNAAVALGGFFGATIGKKYSKEVSAVLNQVMGFVAVAIAVTLIVKVHTLAAVVLALIVGTLIGTALKLEDSIGGFFARTNAKLFKTYANEDELAQFTTLLMLCCTSGTGVFGSITEGLTGDGTIMICKAILDFVTVSIFASQIGKSCAVIAVPQMVFFLLLFCCAKLISPVMTDVLKADFSAAGGIIEMIIAFRILKLCRFKVVDTLPALILVFPISYLWNLVF